MRALHLAPLLSILLAGCTNAPITYPATCTLPAPVPDASASVGDATWATAGVLSSVNDTVVTVGAAHAEVITVRRDGCDDLDTCRSDNGCSACGDCDSCAGYEAACVERVQFRVPDVEPGDQALIVTNALGTSATGTLTVLGGDTGTDTGGSDTGTDTGGSDTGGTDTGGSDTGTDTGGTDTGGSDTGAPPSCI